MHVKQEPKFGSIGPTGDNGKASSGKFVKPQDQDTYYLKELQAPEGYECSDEVIAVPGANMDKVPRHDPCGSSWIQERCPEFSCINMIQRREAH